MADDLLSGSRVATTASCRLGGDPWAGRSVSTSNVITHFPINAAGPTYLGDPENSAGSQNTNRAKPASDCGQHDQE